MRSLRLGPREKGLRNTRETVSNSGEPSTALARLSLLLKYGTLFIAIAYIGLYLFLAWCRVRYPFELEWLEGGSVEHVKTAGASNLCRPSLDFIPTLPPVLLLRCARPGSTVGSEVRILRLVSIVASLISFLTISSSSSKTLVQRYPRASPPGVCCTFRIGGAWFDIARVTRSSSCWCCLVYVVAFTRILAAGRCGLLFSLAILTKQKR